MHCVKKGEGKDLGGCILARQFAPPPLLDTVSREQNGSRESERCDHEVSVVVLHK